MLIGCSTRVRDRIFLIYASSPILLPFSPFSSSLSSPLSSLVCGQVPGNHDMVMDREYYREYWSDWAETIEDDPTTKG